MKEFIVVVFVGLAGVLLAAVGVPVLLVLVLGVVGFLWLLASVGNAPPSAPKKKTTPTGCPFLDFFP